MRAILSVILALALAPGAVAQDAPDEATAPEPSLGVVAGSEADLGVYLWVARPLVVFADAAADPRFAEQIELLSEDVAALNDRDIVVITDTDPRGLSEVRRKLRPRGFMLALMAKDGSVVLRKPAPWTVREITHAVDKLPLRKDELIRERAVKTN